MSLIEQSAEHLFGYFQKILPKPRPGKMRQGEVAQALQKFLVEVRAERERRKLGILARARLALLLQRKLLAAGYSPDLVRQVLFSVLAVALVGKGKQS
jgi:hypothetical protein